ncbi:hypothetical protein AB0C52_12780 [Streptomyces sp. NPDC048717]|uniref:hypothetical protein n=1 Tax=Streptomyces sp. NPDC048717 TaxID=3154928 RepID=UPI003436A5D3
MDQNTPRHFDSASHAKWQRLAEALNDLEQEGFCVLFNNRVGPETNWQSEPFAYSPRWPDAPCVTWSRTQRRWVVELREGAAREQDAPEGLTAYSRGIADLAAARGLRLTWERGYVKHVLRLDADGPHGASGHIVVGAHSGKVLRATVFTPTGRDLEETQADGARAVRELLDGLPSSPCRSGCAAPSADACPARAVAA